MVLVLLAAIALVGVPIDLLRPFKPQGPSFVPWVWTLRRGWAPMVLPLLAAPSLTVPVIDGRAALGTWQSICLLDPNADNAERTVRLSFLAG